MSLVIKNIIANFSGKAWAALMSVAFVPLYIKFMGIESYGLVGIFSSLLALFGLLDMGLSTTLNRELARLSVIPDKAQDMCNLVRTLELPYWGMALLIGVTVTGLSGLIANHWVHADSLPPATVKLALMIMGGVIAFRWPVTLYSGGLMGLQKQILLNTINAGTATFRGVGAVIILWLISPSIYAFLTWNILVSILHVSLAGFFLWRNLPGSSDRPHFSKKALVRIWRFATGMTGISITVIFLTQTDKIILSKILTLEMFGYYTLASAVAQTLYYFIGPVFSALFPGFSQLVKIGDENRLKELYHKGCQFMSVMILPAAIVMSFFSSEILLLWTADPVTVANTQTIVSLLVIGTALNGLMNLPYALQLAYGWTRLALYTNVIATVLLVPLIYFLVKDYGAIGAGAAWIVLNTGYVLIQLQIMHRRLLPNDKWRWYFKDVGIPLVTVLMVTVSWYLFLPDEMSRVGTLFYLFAVSATTLLAAAITTDASRQWLASRLQFFKFCIQRDHG